MRTAIYVLKPTTVTIRSRDEGDQNVQIYRYQSRLPPRPAVGTFEVPAGIYMIASHGELQVSGNDLTTEIAIVDKDPWPDPPAHVLELEAGATAPLVRSFFQIAKGVGD